MAPAGYGFCSAKLYQTIFAQSGVRPTILGAFLIVEFNDGGGISFGFWSQKSCLSGGGSVEQKDIVLTYTFSFSHPEPSHKVLDQTYIWKLVHITHLLESEICPEATIFLQVKYCRWHKSLEK